MKYPVSIVIPCYNHQEFISDAIQSALDQTLKCDIIVVDDGSTDNSAIIASKYPVSLIRQVNKGLSSARNTGIMNAQSDYIQFLDSDDMLKDECVETLLEIAKKTDADIVAPSFKCFGIENQEVVLAQNLKVEDFMPNNRIGYFSLFKKSALLEVGGYSPKMAFGYEDWHMTIDLLKKGKKLVTTKEVLVMYRTRPDSMMSVSRLHHSELVNQIMKDHYSQETKEHEQC